jgi:hypothetical protein
MGQASGTLPDACFLDQGHHHVLALVSAATVFVMCVGLLGCDKIGPMRDHNPQNKVNSPSNPAYQPPADEKPILDIHTGKPRRPGEPI